MTIFELIELLQTIAAWVNFLLELAHHFWELGKLAALHLALFILQSFQKGMELVPFLILVFLADHCLNESSSTSDSETQPKESPSQSKSVIKGPDVHQDRSKAPSHDAARTASL